MDGYGPIANQRLRTSTSVTLSNGKSVTLPEGAFVKVVSKTYMPRNHPFGDYNEEYRVAAYTQYGMALISCDALDFSVY